LPPILRLDDFMRVSVTIFTASVVGGDEVALVLILEGEAEVGGEELVLEDDLPISFNQTRHVRRRRFTRCGGGTRRARFNGHRGPGDGGS
jgi:hypothetical protein